MLFPHSVHLYLVLSSTASKLFKIQISEPVRYSVHDCHLVITRGSFTVYGNVKPSTYDCEKDLYHLSYLQHSVERSEAAEANRRDQIIYVSVCFSSVMAFKGCLPEFSEFLFIDWCEFLSLLVLCVDVCVRTWRGRMRPCRKASGSTTRSREPWWIRSTCCSSSSHR